MFYVLFFFLIIFYLVGFIGQDDEVRGDRVPRLARAEHTAPEHHLEPSRHDEQLLVPLQGTYHTYSGERLHGDGE